MCGICPNGPILSKKLLSLAHALSHCIDIIYFHRLIFTLDDKGQIGLLRTADRLNLFG